MKEIIALIKGNLRKQRGSMIGIVLLIFMVALFLSSVLTIRQNAQAYEDQELERLGYGDLTAWVSEVPDLNQLTDSLRNLEFVDEVQDQPLIFADYIIGDSESDSQGQLLTYEPDQYDYKVFNPAMDGYAQLELKTGEIFVSPVLKSLYGLEIGDEIHFPTVRQQPEQVFRVKGFFEDPFMGSSMIDMKSFLIHPADYHAILQQAQADPEDTLIADGAMLHLYQETQPRTLAEFNQLINEQSQLNNYAQSVYTQPVIQGFMLILQTIFAGILFVFVIILLIVALVIIGYSISSTIEQNYTNLGILKAQGFTSNKLRNSQLLQYLSAISVGLLLGFLASLLLVGRLTQLLVTTTGILVPSNLPIGLIVVAFLAILAVFALFIIVKTRKITKISPLQAIREGGDAPSTKQVSRFPLGKKQLTSGLVLRQLATGSRQYLSVTVIALLLVFFMSLVLRMNAWLGPNGEGMMDAFNPADLDIGVERIGNISAEEVENVITEHTAIIDAYQLAMPAVAINGQDYTANVISDASRFQILVGEAPTTADEILLTEFAAENLAVSLGDQVTVSYKDTTHSFTVSGIYQCANEMGNNLGMTQAGFYQIGEDNELLWCTHYFLADDTQSSTIMAELNQLFGGDVHVHENTWSGLEGIVDAMGWLLNFMYVVIAVFVLIVVVLTGSKVLHREQKDLAIYKALGFTSRHLRSMFALRFAFVGTIGSLLGTLISWLFTDRLVSLLLRMSGISNFASHLTASEALLPAAIIVVMFVVFAYLLACRIKIVSPALLAGE